ncbi:MAG: DinB family protein [Gemmatimonadaceae bacterium]|nr:DinB family protein [Gemmatimonadaceae bacterium]
MSTRADELLLAAVLDSWDRNNTILVNLLRALPDGALDVRPTASSPSIGALFAHIHYVRLIFVAEDAPESASPVPDGEWQHERDRERIAHWLHESAQTVRAAVEKRLHVGRAMDVHYDHPILLVQHMIWHEGYHHGQIKLALKLAGHALADDAIGPVTWNVWMGKT